MGKSVVAVGAPEARSQVCTGRAQSGQVWNVNGSGWFYLGGKQGEAWGLACPLRNLNFLWRAKRKP